MTHGRQADEWVELAKLPGSLFLSVGMRVIVSCSSRVKAPSNDEEQSVARAGVGGEE